MLHSQKIFSSLLLTLTISSNAFSKDWVDIDRNTFIRIEAETLSIYSTDSFFYFDNLFSKVINDGEELILCIGFDVGPGIATDCYSKETPKALFFNEGKTRAMKFNLSHLPFLLDSLNTNLSNGKKIKISINNDKLFSAYSIHKNHKLSANAVKILTLPN